MYNHPLHRQFKPLFTKLQEHFVAATLYHAGKVELCEKLLAMGDEQVTSIKDALKESLPTTLTLDEQVVSLFLQIAQELNKLLEWIAVRLKGQKAWNKAINDVVTVAKDGLAAAVEKHSQEEELKLMRLAEEETIAFNKLLKEQQEKEAAAKKEREQKEEEERKKAEEEQKKKRKQSAQNKRSAGTGMRRNARANVQRKNINVPKAQQQKKPAARPQAAAVSVSEGDKDVLLAAARPETTDEESKADLLEKQDVVDSVDNKEKEVKLLDLSDQELIDVKKSVYEKAYEVFIGSWCETENQLKDFCVLFDTSYDVNAQDKAKRVVFSNIKTRLISWIDFDDELMPIPEKPDQNILKFRNPCEEVATDILNRIDFLFEVKQSNTYSCEVGKQLKIKFEKSDLPGGLDKSVFEEVDDKDCSKASESESTGSIRRWATQSLAVDDFSLLLEQDSSPVHAVYAFTRCSKVTNLMYMRNMMLDQLYCALFRLYGLQITMQLEERLSSTFLSRFVKGSLSYSLGNSILNQIPLCGAKVARQLNAIASRMTKRNINLVIESQEKLDQHEIEYI